MSVFVAFTGAVVSRRVERTVLTALRFAGQSAVRHTRSIPPHERQVVDTESTAAAKARRGEIESAVGAEDGAEERVDRLVYLVRVESDREVHLARGVEVHIDAARGGDNAARVRRLKLARAVIIAFHLSAAKQLPDVEVGKRRGKAARIHASDDADLIGFIICSLKLYAVISVGACRSRTMIELLNDAPVAAVGDGHRIEVVFRALSAVFIKLISGLPSDLHAALSAVFGRRAVRGHKFGGYAVHSRARAARRRLGNGCLGSRIRAARKSVDRFEQAVEDAAQEIRQVKRDVDIERDSGDVDVDTAEDGHARAEVDLGDDAERRPCLQDYRSFAEPDGEAARVHVDMRDDEITLVAAARGVLLGFIRRSDRDDDVAPGSGEGRSEVIVTAVSLAALNDFDLDARTCGISSVTQPIVIGAVIIVRIRIHGRVRQLDGQVERQVAQKRREQLRARAFGVEVDEVTALFVAVVADARGH